MPIAKLSPLLVNQIAAGEVIERPASVVKELVENSLDASATRIDVAIEDGGRELVRVADDGSGIAPGEVLMALEPHATSKISAAHDLAAIRTMGFRGEALASITSVSRLRLTSRAIGADEGAVVEAAGETVGPLQPAGCATGTVIEVRNLFFNTPARRKFMRSAATEFSHIHDLLARIAMAHPAVGFKLAHNGRTTFDHPPGQTALQRCTAILGEELRDGLLEFDSDERGVQLWGLAGLPTLARPTARFQYLYINGRPIRDRNVAHAMKEAYRGLIEPAMQPLIVLFITVDPAAVDVNVHPTKSEVRFADANVIHGQVLATLRQRLLAADLTPSADIGRRPGTIFPAALDLAGGNGDAATASPPSAQAFVEYFRRMDPKQQTLVLSEVRKELGPELPLPDAPPPGEALEMTYRPAPQPVLQVHNSYIVTQDDHGIVIIDQHALHERMMFQELYERICGSGTLESQRLITPAVLDANPRRMDLLENLQPLLHKIGIEAAPLGPATIGIQAFPTLLFDRGVEPGAFLSELLDRAQDVDLGPDDEAALHEVLDMMSCKAAVKAGDQLEAGELTELLRRRNQIERSSNCPHGRPTAIRLTLRDLEKQFKRS